jgi:pentalenene oxygenase
VGSGPCSTVRSAVIPFGGGARKCLGDVFAVTLATLTLATLATRWRLHTLPGDHVRAARLGALYPRGLRMRATQHPHTRATPGA